MSEALFPLFLRLSGKDVLVVGGGAIAERKVVDLREAGAIVRVVAPEVTPAIRESGASIAERAFDDTDIDGAWLVVAATDQADVQARVCAAAERAHVFAIAVDDPPNGSAYSASTIRRGPMTVAISSSGEAPALSRLLREVLEQALPAEDWIDAAKALRARWQREKTPMASRFAELVKAFKERAS